MPGDKKPVKTAAKKTAKKTSGAAAGKKAKSCTHWSNCGSTESKCIKNKCVRPAAK